MFKRNILIIGASSALGIQYIKTYGSQYSKILAHCNSRASELIYLKSTNNTNLQIIEGDLSTETGTVNLIANIEITGIEIDAIAFFAAPRLQIKRINKIDWKDFSSHIEIQTRTSFLLMQKFLPGMAKRGRGKMLFVLSSVLEGKPPTGMADYVVGKYALLGLIKSAAVEYAGKNICINAVSPSMIETSFLSELPNLVIEMNAAAHPRGANATPSDIIPTVHFLLSDGSRFITGQNIIATGGA